MLAAETKKVRRKIEGKRGAPIINSVTDTFIAGRRMRIVVIGADNNGPNLDGSSYLFLDWLEDNIISSDRVWNVWVQHLLQGLAEEKVPLPIADEYYHPTQVMVKYMREKGSVPPPMPVSPALGSMEDYVDIERAMLNPLKNVRMLHSDPSDPTLLMIRDKLRSMLSILASGCTDTIYRVFKLPIVHGLLRQYIRSQSELSSRVKRLITDKIRELPEMDRKILLSSLLEKERMNKKQWKMIGDKIDNMGDQTNLSELANGIGSVLHYGSHSEHRSVMTKIITYYELFEQVQALELLYFDYYTVASILLVGEDWNLVLCGSDHLPDIREILLSLGFEITNEKVYSADNPEQSVTVD